MDMRKIQTIALVLGLTMVSIWTYFRLTRPTGTITTASNGDGTKLPVLGTRSLDNNRRDVSDRQKLNPLESAANLIRMPLKREGDEALLTVELFTFKRCGPGDLDALGLELKGSGLVPLLSLENLAGTKTFSVPLEPSFINQEITRVDFRVPVKGPEQFGIFLCTARPGDRECGRKSFVDLNEIFREHSQPALSPREPRNLFFQYVLLDPFGVATPAFEPRPATFKALAKYVDALNLGRDAGRELGQAEKLSLTLMGLPLEYTEGRVRVVLPRYDKATCRKDPIGARKRGK